MSILLDALKRSESQRELGSVPTLQTSTEVPDRSGAETPAWVAAALVLLAIALMTWLGVQQYHVPAEMPETSMAQQSADSSLSGEVESSEQAEDENSPPADKSILPKFTGAKVQNSDRSNAEKARLEAELSADRNVRDYVATEQVSAASSEPTRDDAVRPSQLPKVEIDRREQTTAAGKTNASEPYEPDMISYWQIPESMREGLPDLRISVLVFAEQPENRFLLLNGERMQEGEELPNGLLLEEIRRDRAIFNYRNYRFYLKS